MFSFGKSTTRDKRVVTFVTRFIRSSRFETRLTSRQVSERWKRKTDRRRCFRRGAALNHNDAAKSPKIQTKRGLGCRHASPDGKSRAASSSSGCRRVLVPARRTEHLLIAQLLNPVAQLGSKCLYVLQSKARERGRRVLRERIRSDILRASTREHPPSRLEWCDAGKWRRRRRLRPRRRCFYRCKYFR